MFGESDMYFLNIINNYYAQVIDNSLFLTTHIFVFSLLKD